jgi:hypothetical protein
MIDELTATLTATRSTISPSTKIITHNLPPNRNHGGPSRTLRMDLRICECVVMAVLGGLPPGSGPVVSGDSLRIWPRKRVPFI